MMFPFRFASCLLASLALLTGCSTYSKLAEKSTAQVAVTPTQRELVKSMKGFSKQPLLQLGGYIDAANLARLELARNPANTLARSDYNFAVARIIGIIGDEELTPWEAPLQANSVTAPNGQWTFSLIPPDRRSEYRPENVRILPADRLDFKGKLVGGRTLKQGLGAPVVVVGKHANLTKIDPFAQGDEVYYGFTVVLRFDDESNCSMMVLDPLEQESVSLDDHVYQLAADFQAPVALSLAELAPRKNELGGMFSPADHIESARLTRLQPYSPDKIPVLFVHGLGDSEATWAPMVNFLREDEQIRQNFQFWIFSYPTGAPYPMTGAILRDQMNQIGQRYPDHKDIVLVGHSMGGMISRLLVTEAGTSLWDVYYDKPPEQLSFSAETREVMTKALIFNAQPRVSRVIFASPSHRGSGDATNFTGRLGVKLIGNPFNDNVLADDAISQMRPEIRDTGQIRIPNSIEVLNPDHRLLAKINALPTKAGLPYHSILGDRGRGGNLDKTKPESSDGIVPYWSSHMDGAESEVIIPSDHWTIHHPQGMTEMQRILLRHLRSR